MHATTRHSQPLVSIVVPFWNAARYLQATIASVCAQTYPHWELLLVDDGSSDQSTALAQAAAAASPARIRYLAHPGQQHRGSSATRNRGILQAQGAFLAFLDADDIWHPAKLARQLAMFTAHPQAALVYGPATIWWSWTGKAQDQGRDVVQDLGLVPDMVYAPPVLLPHFLAHEEATIYPSSALIRTDVCQHIGLFEAAFCDMYDDQVFFAKVCLATPVYASSACLFWYRRHSQSLCATMPRDPARAAFLTWLQGYLMDHKIADPRIWQTLAQEQRVCRRLLGSQGQ